MDTENDFENNNILRIFINILDGFLDLISSKYCFNQIQCQSIRQIILILNVHYWIKRCILSSQVIFSIKMCRNLPNYIQWLIFLQTMNMKYNFSEIIYHVLRYWKWFAEINDSALPPSLMYIYVCDFSDTVKAFDTIFLLYFQISVNLFW